MTAAVSFALCLGLGWIGPWWTPALAGLALGFWKPGVRSLLNIALGGAAAWGIVALAIHILNRGLLGGKIAALFQLPGGAWMVAATAALGGITAGLGALAGQSILTMARRTRI